MVLSLLWWSGTAKDEFREIVDGIFATIPSGLVLLDVYARVQAEFKNQENRWYKKLQDALETDDTEMISKLLGSGGIFPFSCIFETIKRGRKELTGAREESPCPRPCGSPALQIMVVLDMDFCLADYY